MIQGNKSIAYGSGIKDIIKLAWPIMLSMATHTIMDITDTVMVGWLGTKELAAIGVATTVYFLIKAYFIGMFEGVKIRVSQKSGENDLEAAKEFGFNSLYLALPFSLLILSLSLFSKQIFYIFGGPAGIQEISITYFNIRVFSAFFGFFTLALTNYFQGIGETKLPMQVNILNCALNIVLDALLIYGAGPIPALGVRGSAFATVISTAVGSLLLMAIFLKRVGFKPLIKERIKDLLSVGWPSGIRWFFDIASFTIFTAIVARLGEVELAANQICVKILCLSILPCWGIAEATCIITGNHFGAKRHLLVRKTFFSALKFVALLMSAVGLVFIFARAYLVSFFNPSPEVAFLGVNLMFLLAIHQFLESVQNTASLALYGTGDTKYPMIASLTGSWLIMLPLAYFLGIYKGLGLLGMWIAACVSLSFIGCFVITRFLISNKLRMENSSERLDKDSAAIDSSREEEPLSHAV